MRSSQRANVDETGWLVRASRHFLWAVRTPRVTFFVIRKTRSQEVAREVLSGFSGVVGTDGYNAYHFISERRRQYCWAHCQTPLLTLQTVKGTSRRVERSP